MKFYTIAADLFCTYDFICGKYNVNESLFNTIVHLDSSQVMNS